MATITSIKNQVISYLQPTNAAALVAEGSEDLVLNAINRARIFLERRHDWSFTYVYAYLDCDPDAELSEGKLVSDDSSVSLRKLDRAYLAGTTADIPIRLLRKSVEAQEQLNGQDARPILDYYTNDSQVTEDLYIETGEPRAVQIGTNVRYHPYQTATKRVRFDAYKWMDAYSTGDETDYFTDYGSDALFWAAIVEVNYATTTFSDFDREGGQKPPIRERDRAIESLIVDDLQNQPF